MLSPIKPLYIDYKIVGSILKRGLLVIILTCLSASVFAQEKKTKDLKLARRVDSLVAVIGNSNTPIAEKIEMERQVYNLSKSIDYKRGLVMGKLTLMNELVNLSKYDQALKLIDEHMAEAVDLEIPSYIIELLILKATCYSSLGFYKESKAVLNQAKSYSLKLQHNDAFYYAQGQISAQMAWNIEAANGNLDSVLFYLRNGVKQFAKLNVKREANVGLLSVLNRIGLVYFDKKQYDSAEKYLPYIYQIKMGDRKKDKVSVLMDHVTAASLHFIRKDYQRSLADYQSALDLSTSLKLPYYQKPIYEGLAQVYDKLGDKKNEVIFLKKYAKIADSLSHVEKQSMQQPLENIIKDKNAANYKNRNYDMLLIAAITIFMIGFIFFYRFKRNPAGIVEEIKTPLNEQTTDNNSIDRLNDIIELAKQNSPLLYIRFNEFDPTFCQKLLAIAPDLLISELELCIYIRLNFETKEIARYANFSVKAVQDKKYRTRKKLKILPNKDLTQWILNI